MNQPFSSETAYRLLCESVEAFNSWRLENIDSRVELQKKDFTGKDLSKALLVNADLSEAMFGDCRLNEAIFCASNLTSADFLNTQICDAIFGPPELLTTKLDQRLARYLLQGANLRNACFRGADLTGSVLRETNIEGADFGYTHLDYVDFRGTIPESACFEKAYLADTLFDGESPTT